MADELEFFTSEVPFKVDGKRYVGIMTAKAWDKLQNHWGLTGLAELQDRLGKISIADTPLIVWASLMKHHPNLTQEQGEEIADGMGMQGVVQYVSALVKAGSPPAAAMVRANPTKRAKARRKH